MQIVIYLIISLVIAIGFMGLVKYKGYKVKSKRKHVIPFAIFLLVLITVVMYYVLEFTGIPIAMVFYTFALYIVYNIELVDDCDTKETGYEETTT